MNPGWIGAVIGVISMVAGVFHHYVFVRTEIVAMKKDIQHLEKRVTAHEEAFPAMLQVMNEIRTDIAVIKTQMEANASQR